MEIASRFESRALDEPRLWGTATSADSQHPSEAAPRSRRVASRASLAAGAPALKLRPAPVTDPVVVMRERQRKIRSLLFPLDGVTALVSVLGLPAERGWSLQLDGRAPGVMQYLPPRGF